MNESQIRIATYEAKIKTRGFLKMSMKNIGWVDISAKAVSQLRRDLEATQGIRDEVGMLGIHTGYSDRFFPTTSVLHTRPRYFFFAVWCILDAIKYRRDTKIPFFQRLQNEEWRVTERLIQSGEEKGIIGKRLYEDWEKTRKAKDISYPQQPPTFAYWAALQQLGFVRFLEGRGSRTSLAYLNGDEIIHPENQKPGSRKPDEGSLKVIFSLPRQPSAWRPKQGKDAAKKKPKLTLDMTKSEAITLKKRLQAQVIPQRNNPSGPGKMSLLAALVENPEKFKADSKEFHTGEGPWKIKRVLEVAREIGELDALTRAMQASALAKYVRAFYWQHVAMMANRIYPPPIETFSLKHIDIDQLWGPNHRNDIKNACALDLEKMWIDLNWNRKNDRGVSRLLEKFQETLKMCESAEEARKKLLTKGFANQFTEVEKNRKKNRARLTNPLEGSLRKDLENARADGLHYRWEVVAWLLHDLRQGLKSS